MAFNKGKESKRRSDHEKKDRSKFDSKSITRIVISLFVAAAVSIGATYYEAYLLSDKNVTPVVIAIENVKEGTLIDESNVNEYFKLKEVNSSLVSDNTVKSLDSLSGKATVDITKGEIVTTQRFMDTSEERDKFKNPVMITYTVTDASYAVGGTIREGDIVDILEIVTTETGTKESQVLVKDAYVLKACDGSGNVISRDDTTSIAMSFTVYVERDEECNYNPKMHEELSVTKVVLAEE